MSTLANKILTELAEDNKTAVHYLSLNLRGRFIPFNLPGIEELSAALNETRPDQQGMLLSALRGGGQGIYKIQLTQPINDICTLKVTLRERIEVPLADFAPFNQMQNRKVGTYHPPIPESDPNVKWEQVLCRGRRKTPIPGTIMVLNIQTQKKMKINTRFKGQK